MLDKMGYTPIDCPHCGFNIFVKDDDRKIPKHNPHCEAEGATICNMCDGAGCMDTPFSGSEPGCEMCSGRGYFLP